MAAGGYGAPLLFGRCHSSPATSGGAAAGHIGRAAHGAQEY
jgi:hypothetical protein